MRHRARAVAVALVAWAGCARAPSPPAPPPPPDPPLPAAVWTTRPDVPLRQDTAWAWVRRPFSRLEVVAADSPGGLRVVCRVCPDTAAGVVAPEDVLADPLAPDSAAHGSLAQFALAVRHAAAARDLATLRTLMADDFTFSLVGQQSRDAALTAWRSGGHRALDSVPALLDGGLAPAPSAIWAAPPEYAERIGYRGLRLGFRRSPAGRWQWLFLIRSEGTG